MNIILFDDPQIRPSLLPFTFTRSVAAIRIGIFTIEEKWRIKFGATTSYLTEAYLSGKFAPDYTEDNYYINSCLIPDQALVDIIKKLKTGSALVYGDLLLAVRSADEMSVQNILSLPFVKQTIDSPPFYLKNNWDIFALNGKEIRNDFNYFKTFHTSASITDPYTRVYGMENVFIEEGADIKAAIINAENGPVYIGKHTQIQEGCLIRGPFALCEGSTVNMGAKLRGDNTIGPYCKVGGELIPIPQI